MLSQRRRRWPSIRTALGQCLVFVVGNGFPWIKKQPATRLFCRAKPKGSIYSLVKSADTTLCLKRAVFVLTDTWQALQPCRRCELLTRTRRISLQPSDSPFNSTRWGLVYTMLTLRGTLGVILTRFVAVANPYFNWYEISINLQLLKP